MGEVIPPLLGWIQYHRVFRGAAPAAQWELGSVHPYALPENPLAKLGSSPLLVLWILPTLPSWCPGQVRRAVTQTLPGGRVAQLALSMDSEEIIAPPLPQLTSRTPDPEAFVSIPNGSLRTLMDFHRLPGSPMPQVQPQRKARGPQLETGWRSRRPGLTRWPGNLASRLYHLEASGSLKWPPT